MPQEEGVSVDHGTHVSLPEKPNDILLHEQQAQYQKVFRQHAHLVPPSSFYDVEVSYSPNDSDKRLLIDPLVKPMHLQWPDSTHT
jgi:hypothetical protein